ncbi:MAG: Asp-tRNA(Asn)/Glu-tRNA(Gln) amidotransferase subunit GatA [Thermodesulfobacteriota bacterium]|nr:Asp-tRNA(Asn)/Glu-tRNA(Gln) amidotransferase subunit GatA [Thermodesulfobacteriota bacterium]
MQLYALTIHALRELLLKKEVTSVEITGSVLARIKEVDHKVHAYLTLTPEVALEQAREADRILQKGEGGPLTGIPMSIKDVVCTEGIRTTCGSYILKDFVPIYDATVIRRLKEAGAVLLGKVNMDEFAMGSSTENSAFHITRNPWRLDYIPGGSSGGSAAAVAADECIASLGSDTGGSIRQPAAHCGVVGLKPTYGTVSRYGLVAFASSLDQIGPLTKDVTDCALVLNAVHGHDPLDSTSAPRPRMDYTKALVKGIKGIKIGIPKEYFGPGLSPEVEKSVRNAIETLSSLGAETVEISLPHTEYAVAIYYIIAPAEASSNLARYDGVKYGYRDAEAKELLEMYEKTRSGGFGAEVKRRIMLGTYALSSGYYDAYYKKASQVRTLIAEDFKKGFDRCDVILTPVAPTPPFKIGEKVNDPFQMYLSDIFTVPANLAGLPAISVPCGFSAEGLPVGIQLLGNHFAEEKILQVAYNFESETDFHTKKPALLS